VAHNWTAAKEKASRDWAKSTINAVDPDLPVMITPFYFSGKEDFIAQVYQMQVDSMTEAQYDAFESSFAIITFLRFQDSDTDGCDDNPVTFVWYNIHIFKQFKDVRAAGTNSHDELLDLVVALHNRFLDDREHPTYGESLTRYPLTQPNNLQRRAESEFLVGQVGDIINLQVRMEVR